MKERAILFGYWPLFDYIKYSHLIGVATPIAASELTKAVFPEVGIDFCLWTLNNEDNSAAAIFVLNHAETVATHLISWAQDLQTEWFKVMVADNDGRYAIALFPEVQKSIDRWKFAQALNAAEMKEYDFEVVFRPLIFGSPTSTVYTRIKRFIKSKMHVALMDIKDFDKNNPFEIKPDKLFALGEFEVMKDVAPIQSWIDEYLSDLKPPGIESMINTSVQLPEE